MIETFFIPTKIITKSTKLQLENVNKLILAKYILPIAIKLTTVRENQVRETQVLYIF